MAVGHLSPQTALPILQQKNINTLTWGAGGNTCTIVDPYIHPNSQIDIWVTGTTPPSGQWAQVVTQGQVLLTSSSSENSTLTFAYLVF